MLHDDVAYAFEYFHGTLLPQVLNMLSDKEALCRPAADDTSCSSPSTMSNAPSYNNCSASGASRAIIVVMVHSSEQMASCMPLKAKTDKVMLTNLLRSG